MNLFRTSDNRIPIDFLVLIVFVLFLTVLRQSSQEVSLVEVLTAVAIPGIVAWALIRRTLSTYPELCEIALPRWAIAMMLFGGWLILNVAVGIRNDVPLLNWGRRAFPVMTLTFVLWFSVITFRTRRSITFGYFLLIITGVVAVLGALIGIRGVDLTSITSLQAIRQYGGGYYNAFGLSLVLPALYGIRAFSRIQQAVIVGSTIIFGAGLIITFTRTYWVSTFVTVGVIVLLLGINRPKKHWLRWSILLIPALAVGVSIVAPDSLLAFFLKRIASIPHALSTPSVQERFMEIRGILQSSGGNYFSMLIGHGFGSEYTYYSVNPFIRSTTGYIQKEYAHNYYAYIYWTTGIVGLMLYIGFWTLFLRDSIAAIWHSNSFATIYLLAIVSASINILISSLTAPQFMNVEWGVYFGILLGMAYNLTYTVDNEGKV